MSRALSILCFKKESEKKSKISEIKIEVIPYGGEVGGDNEMKGEHKRPRQVLRSDDSLIRQGVKRRNYAINGENGRDKRFQSCR